MPFESSVNIISAFLLQSIKLHHNHNHYHRYVYVLLLLCKNFLDQIGSSTAAVSFNGETKANIIDIGIVMSTGDRSSRKTDEYLCTARKLNLSEDEVYIEAFEYHNLDMNSNVHHFLLYGCKTISNYFLDNEYWPCHTSGKGSICTERKQIPLGLTNYERDEPNKARLTKYPPNVRYGIGKTFEINFLMLELHYIAGRENPPVQNTSSNSTSGIKISLTNIKPKYYAGMITMAGVGFRIPPGREKFSIDINCQPRISSPLHPYAYWVHSHELGRVISGYKVDKKTGIIKEIARWSHHWPQPVILDLHISGNSSFTLFPGDFLAAKCTYNSLEKKSFTNWGRRRFEDEMCNLFLFFYTESSNPNDISVPCVNELSRQISQKLPKNSNSLEYIQSPLNNKLFSNEQEPQLKTDDNFKQSLVCDLYRKFKIKNCPYA